MRKPPGGSAPKNAVLQPAAKVAGDSPYVPAPPRSNQPNFLTSAFRKLSSSGGQLANGHSRGQHGLCERRVLNVDRNRDRCRVPGLDQAKLRRVAFCVDVEIAGGPRYRDDDGDERYKEKKTRKKLVEKGEGEALKHPDTLKEEKEKDGVIKATGEVLPKEPKVEGVDANAAPAGSSETPADQSADKSKETTRKKEKKKRSEEERKARKEKKRKLAEANGTIPVELVRNSSDSSLSDAHPQPHSAAPKHPQVSPTTDPVRIYRRCCQLRETPILKKITEQLSSPTNRVVGQPCVVQRLDLSGYWLQLADLLTLGDYLAVVPIKEIILENCGLTDEGVRVVLAGLLETKTARQSKRRSTISSREGNKEHRGVVERVVLKNNTNIGKSGWQYICTFMYLSRSLKYLDLSMIPFPQAPTTPKQGNGLKRTPSSDCTIELASILSTAIGERLAGPELELINMAETGLNAEQLGLLIDGVIKSGLRRLGLAGNNITAEGLEHVARYLRQSNCEGLDLGGNDLQDLLEVVANALEEAIAKDKNYPLWALSLADCNMSPDSLWKLLPGLAKLRNFRFLDLSHNQDLFATKPSSALPSLRR